MFKALREGVTLPKCKTTFSAGYDICFYPENNEAIILEPFRVTVLETGIALDKDYILPKLYQSNEFSDVFLELHLRSSLRARGVTSLGTGIIDIDYFDEIKVIAMSLSEEVIIPVGARIAQLIIVSHLGRTLLGNEYREETLRNGGFGSTGKH